MGGWSNERKDGPLDILMGTFQGSSLSYNQFRHSNRSTRNEDEEETEEDTI